MGEEPTYAGRDNKWGRSWGRVLIPGRRQQAGSNTNPGEQVTCQKEGKRWNPQGRIKRNTGHSGTGAVVQEVTIGSKSLLCVLWSSPQVPSWVLSLSRSIFPGKGGLARVRQDATTIREQDWGSGQAWIVEETRREGMLLRRLWVDREHNTVVLKHTLNACTIF